MNAPVNSAVVSPMPTSPMTLAAAPISGVGTTATIVGSGSFLICSTDGWIHPGGMEGYFVGDTRMLSTMFGVFNGHPMQVIRTHAHDECIEVLGIVGDLVRPDLLVTTSLSISNARLQVELDIANLTNGPLDVVFDLAVASDFADIFDVRRSERPRSGFVGTGPSEGDLVLSYENGGFRRGLRISSGHDTEVLRDGIRVTLHLEHRGRDCLSVSGLPEGARHQPLIAMGPPTATESVFDEHRPPPPGMEKWRLVWHRALDDLEDLLIADPLDPTRITIAAGSPWFMTLFGRDSLIASWESLILGTRLAENTLDALADRQGMRMDAVTEEEPGKILHEVRTGEAVMRSSGWGAHYYGTVDATPLFVMLLHEAWRWGADEDHVRRLMPAAERAIAWIEQFGDRDGDGFVEYGQAGSPIFTSLSNLAWKDSNDAVRTESGDIADGPIAMVEVQAYCHAALLALADLRERFRSADPQPLRDRARALQQHIDEAYWLDDLECYAMALDGSKKPVRSVSSNAGHLLWTGTALPERAHLLMPRLLQPDMFTGFGIRTLSTDNPAYNPLSYHCGSVWPHDTAIIAAGYAAYDNHEGARTIAEALLSAAEPNGRLPELFAGFDKAEQPIPVPYASSCSPQAWAAGAPLLLTRALLGLTPERG